MEEPLVIVDRVSKKFCRDFRTSLRYGIRDIAAELIGRRNGNPALRKHEFWALKNVSFEVSPEDRIAIIGRNGAGKSTLLKLINGRLRLDSGRILIRGKIAAINELGTAFNPVQTGRENIFNAAAVYGFSRAAAEKLMPSIIDFAGIHDAMDSAVAMYSSGMRARLGYAIAAHVDPDLFILDEVLAAGDVLFRQRCFDHLMTLQRRKKAVIMATHDFRRIQSVCNRLILIEGGVILFNGDVTEGVQFYLNSLEQSVGDSSNEALKKLKTRIFASELDQTSPGRRPTIEDVRVQFSSNTIETGPIVTVELTCSSTTEIQDVSWGFLILDHNFRLVSSGYSAYAGKQYKLHNGTNVFRCAFNVSSFKPGIHHLKCTVNGMGGVSLARHGWKEPHTSFEVPSSSNPELNHIPNKLTELSMEWS